MCLRLWMGMWTLQGMSHSPLYSTLEPFAALILVWLSKSSVLNLPGIFLHFPKDITHFPGPKSQSVLLSLSPILIMILQSSFFPIFTIPVSMVWVNICTSQIVCSFIWEGVTYFWWLFNVVDLVIPLPFLRRLRVTWFCLSTSTGSYILCLNLVSVWGICPTYSAYVWVSSISGLIWYYVGICEYYD